MKMDFFKSGFIISLLFILILSISMVSAEDVNLNENCLDLNDVSEDVSLDSIEENSLDYEDVSLDSIEENSLDYEDVSLDSVDNTKSTNSYIKENFGGDSTVGKKLMDPEDFNKHIVVDFGLYYDTPVSGLYKIGDMIGFGIDLLDDDGNRLCDNATLEIYDNDTQLVYQKDFLIDGIYPYYYFTPDIGSGVFTAKLNLKNYNNITFKYDFFPVFEIIGKPVYHIEIQDNDVTERGYFIGNDYNLTLYCNVLNEDGYWLHTNSICVKVNGRIVDTYDNVLLDSDNNPFIVIKGLQLGKNNITLDYIGEYRQDGDELYFETIPLTLLLNGYEKMSFININFEKFYLGDDATLNVSLVDDNNSIINETFSLEITDETDYENVFENPFIITANQTITIDKKHLIEGHQYHINANFAGENLNYTYSPAHCEKDLYLSGKPPLINLTQSSFNNEEDILLSFFVCDSLNNPISGDINFTLDNKSYSVKLINGTSDELNVGKLEFGNYTILGNFKSEFFNSPSFNTIVHVLKVTKLFIEADDVVSGESSTINFTLKANEFVPLNGIIYLTIYNALGESKAIDELNLTGGKASYTLENVSESYYICGICHLDDIYDDYVDDYALGYASIRLIENLPTIDLELNNDSTSVIVSLKDLDGNAVSNASLQAIVGETDYNLTTDAKGQAIFAIGINETAKVTYTGAKGASVSSSIVNNVINNVIENTVYVNVTPNRTATKIIYSDMVTDAVAKVDGRVGKYFEVTLQDANGKVLANKLVQIGFNGAVYNRTTNATGGVKLQINLGYEGKYTFAIAFLGDDNYTGSFEVALITVNKHSPKLTAPAKTFKVSGKTKTLTATFLSANNNPISGKKISFTINGKTYAGITNSKGVVSVKISLNKKGTYSATAKYAGDGMYKETSTKFIVKIK